MPSASPASTPFPGASYGNAEFYFKSGVYVQQKVGRDDEAAEACFVAPLTGHARRRA